MSGRSGSSRGGKRGYQQRGGYQHHKQHHNNNNNNNNNHIKSIPLSTPDHYPAQYQPPTTPVLAPASGPSRTVLVNNLVAVQIIKHARDNIPALVTGQLLGFDVDHDVEVTYSFPLLKG